MKHEGYCTEEHRNAFEQRLVDRLISWRERHPSSRAEEPVRVNYVTDEECAAGFTPSDPLVAVS
jgi:hypothetical protein